MRGKILCGNSTVELWDDILEVELLQRRYFKLDYGGLCYLKTLKSMLDIVTPAKE
jgi:hypothetical protein